MNLNPEIEQGQQFMMKWTYGGRGCHNRVVKENISKLKITSLVEFSAFICIGFHQAIFFNVAPPPSPTTGDFRTKLEPYWFSNRKAKFYTRAHCDLKVSRSQTKIDENFANYFLKTKASNKCFVVLKCTCKGLQKSISEL